MGTGCSLTVCWHLLPRGSVCLVWGGLPGLGGRGQGGLPGLGGCLPGLGGLPGPGGVAAWSWGGQPGPRGSGGSAWSQGGGCLVLGVAAWSQGGSAWSWGWVGGGIPACTEADPPLNRMTDRCKNITLGTTSLRPVINDINDIYLEI